MNFTKLYPTKKGAAWQTADPENFQRADWAEACLDRFREVCRGDNDVTAFTDLIANLGHAFDRMKATHNCVDLTDEYDFESVIDSALMHYEAERKGEF